MNSPETREKRRRRHERGFSLIELIVVLVILGLLATVVAPKVMDRLKGAKKELSKVDIANLEQALDLFSFDVGHYPTTEEGLQALLTNPGSDQWKGPYLKKTALPKDPWQRDFVYRCPGQHGDYDLLSLGADGQEGGEGENADITSWGGR
jgi:general secretion pathway protein G